MTPWVYGRLTLAREQTSPQVLVAEAQTPPAEEAAAGKDARKPYVDALAGLVPADILAFHALVVSQTTETKKVGGEAVTTITSPGWLKAMFFVGFMWAAFEYVLAHRKGGRPWDRSDMLRMLIPAVAFWAWTGVQRNTAFDAIFPGADEPSRVIVGAALALALGLVARQLALQANQSEPSVAVAGTASPRGGDRANT